MAIIVLSNVFIFESYPSDYNYEETISGAVVSEREVVEENTNVEEIREPKPKNYVNVLVGNTVNWFSYTQDSLFGLSYDCAQYIYCDTCAADGGNCQWEASGQNCIEPGGASSCGGPVCVKHSSCAAGCGIYSDDGGTTCYEDPSCTVKCCNLGTDCSTTDCTESATLATCSDCSSGNAIQCSDDGNAYTNDGICADSGSSTYACDEDDVIKVSSTYYQTCDGSSDGYACDVTTAGGWTQDSMCLSDTNDGAAWDCKTTGHSCYDGTYYEDTCASCSAGNGCDSTITAGGDFGADGICLNDNSCDVVSEAAKDCTYSEGSCSNYYLSCASPSVAINDICDTNIADGSFSNTGVCDGATCLACAGSETTCDDGLDEDCDGPVDGADSDCGGNPCLITGGTTTLVSDLDCSSYDNLTIIEDGELQVNGWNVNAEYIYVYGNLTFRKIPGFGNADVGHSNTTFNVTAENGGNIDFLYHNHTMGGLIINTGGFVNGSNREIHLNYTAREVCWNNSGTFAVRQGEVNVEGNCTFDSGGTDSGKQLGKLYFAHGDYNTITELFDDLLVNGERYWNLTQNTGCINISGTTLDIKSHDLKHENHEWGSRNVFCSSSGSGLINGSGNLYLKRIDSYDDYMNINSGSIDINSTLYIAGVDAIVTSGANDHVFSNISLVELDGYDTNFSQNGYDVIVENITTEHTGTASLYWNASGNLHVNDLFVPSGTGLTFYGSSGKNHWFSNFKNYGPVSINERGTIAFQDFYWSSGGTFNATPGISIFSGQPNLFDTSSGLGFDLDALVVNTTISFNNNNTKYLSINVTANGDVQYSANITDIDVAYERDAAATVLIQPDITVTSNCTTKNGVAIKDNTLGTWVTSLFGEGSTWVVHTCSCTSADNCPTDDSCIDGQCGLCSVPNDGISCSINSNVYNSADGGVCITNYTGTQWICDHDEVAFYTVGDNYYETCYEINHANPTEINTCDSAVGAGYTADGLCAYSASEYALGSYGPTGFASYSIDAAGEGTVYCNTTSSVCWEDDGVVLDNCGMSNGCSFSNTDLDPCMNYSTGIGMNGYCVDGADVLDSCATGIVNKNESTTKLHMGCTQGGGQICDSDATGSEDGAFTSYVDGVCVGNWTCDGGCVINPQCAGIDVAKEGSSYYVCGSADDSLYYGDGYACDQSTTSSGWAQDSMCLSDVDNGADWDCKTTGHACYDGTYYEDTCASCADANGCTSTLTSGDFSASGVCLTDNTCDETTHAARDCWYGASCSTYYSTCSEAETNDRCDIDITDGAYSDTGLCNGASCDACGGSEICYNGLDDDCDGVYDDSDTCDCIFTSTVNAVADINCTGRSLNVSTTGTLNMAGYDITAQNATVEGTLTSTSGVFQIAGVGGMFVESTGAVTAGSGNDNISGLIIKSSGTYSASSDTTELSEFVGYYPWGTPTNDGYILDLDGTFTHNNGLVLITADFTGYSYALIDANGTSGYNLYDLNISSSITPSSSCTSLDTDASFAVDNDFILESGGFTPVHDYLHVGRDFHKTGGCLVMGGTDTIIVHGNYTVYSTGGTESMNTGETNVFGNLSIEASGFSPSGTSLNLTGATNSTFYSVGDLSSLDKVYVDKSFDNNVTLLSDEQWLEVRILNYTLDINGKTLNLDTRLTGSKDGILYMRKGGTITIGNTANTNKGRFVVAAGFNVTMSSGNINISGGDTADAEPDSATFYCFDNANFKPTGGYVRFDGNSAPSKVIMDDPDDCYFYNLDINRGSNYVINFTNSTKIINTTMITQGQLNSENANATINITTPTVYGILNLSNGANHTISGNLSIQSGGEFYATNETLIFNESAYWLYNEGDFNHQNGTVQFDGNMEHTLGAITFNNITVTKNVTISSPVNYSNISVLTSDGNLTYASKYFGAGYSAHNYQGDHTDLTGRYYFKENGAIVVVDGCTLTTNYCEYNDDTILDNTLDTAHDASKYVDYLYDRAGENGNWVVFGKAISMQINGFVSGVQWSSVNLSEAGLPADGNNGIGDTTYAINISEADGTLVDVYVKADGDLTSGGDIIDLVNETIAYSITDTTVPSTTNVSLTTSYTDNQLGEDFDLYDDVYMKFFVDVLSNQAAGTYSNDLSFKAIESNEAP